ncbi:class I adenylate-forming enzyme family protein [Sandaracinobacteroides saxicola]|uniref:AMP-binding protein n=1 Tax=Sandaracinobacteroides saxicola TaxID=2759707 RepID=A0A7G5II99_9SPHN|nr:AMP-binding protein [Sandaracinobacteroides saxicola]QMW23091.1 AMP-binding protein [Sandaracinobacteroides saxicola]
MSAARREMTLAGGILAAAARWPDRAAIEHASGTTSYRALADAIRRAANMARARGLEPGDRALLMAANTPAYVEIVAGLSEAGVIVVTLSHRLTVAEVAAIIDDCTPRLLLADGASEAILRAAAPGLPLVSVPGGWRALLSGASAALVAGPAETDSFAMAYTSGTTGAAKGVMLSHRSRALMFMAMAGEYGCFGPGDRFLALTPMAHGAGFAFAAAPLFYGGTCVLADSTDPAWIAERIAAPDIDGVFVVPTILSRLGGLPAGACLRGARLRTIISNAAALAQPLKEMVIERFGDGLLHETYGSTEAGIVTNIRPDELRARPGSVGTPFPLIELSLRDDAGAEVPADTPGELFVRGPYAFNGYWNRPEATAEALCDGWVTVGDVATRDAQGFVRIVDRKKDMVVSGGINVWPGEIEAVLAAVPGVREAAVVGLPDGEWGERLHAFIVGTAAPEALASAVRARLASYKVPKGFSFLDELPRNAAGKLLKRELRDHPVTTG